MNKLQYFLQIIIDKESEINTAANVFGPPSSEKENGTWLTETRSES